MDIDGRADLTPYSVSIWSGYGVAGNTIKD